MSKQKKTEMSMDQEIAHTPNEKLPVIPAEADLFEKVASGDVFERLARHFGDMNVDVLSVDCKPEPHTYCGEITVWNTLYYVDFICFESTVIVLSLVSVNDYEVSDLLREEL